MPCTGDCVFASFASGGFGSCVTIDRTVKPPCNSKSLHFTSPATDGIPLILSKSLSLTLRVSVTWVFLSGRVVSNPRQVTVYSQQLPGRSAVSLTPINTILPFFIGQSKSPLDPPGLYFKVTAAAVVCSMKRAVTVSNPDASIMDTMPGDIASREPGFFKIMVLSAPAIVVYPFMLLVGFPRSVAFGPVSRMDFTTSANPFTMT